MAGFPKNWSWKIWAGLAAILALPALLIHLPLNPFLEDEAIRATVALEMQYSGNYIVPTINGDFYYA